MHFFHVSCFLDQWPEGKCLIFGEAAIAGLTELSLAGSFSGCEWRVRLV
jgi:hypothetical protein